MIVYHAGGLHVGVTYSGAKKFEAPLFHVFTDGVGYFGADWRLAYLIIYRLTIGHKAAEVFIKGAKLLLNLNKVLRVGDGRGNFKPVTDDACILH